MARFRAGFLSGGSCIIPGFGEPSLVTLLEHANGLTLAEAKAALPATLAEIDQGVVVIDGARWKWDAASALTGDDNLVIEITAAPATGRFLRLPGECELVLPFTYATADAAVLYTMPTGAKFMPYDFAWTVGAGFTGGTASAIGVSTTKSGMTTKGDLLGGAAGDVAATLVAGSYILGTIGAKWDAVDERRQVWSAAEIFRFDRITSAFTAGSGSVRVIGRLLANAGA